MEYMKSLFEAVVNCIRVISHNHRDTGTQIQKRLQASKDLGFFLTGSMEGTSITSPWERSKQSLETETIYGFALKMDIALLKGTDLELESREISPKTAAPTTFQIDTESATQLRGVRSRLRSKAASLSKSTRSKTIRGVHLKQVPVAFRKPSHRYTEEIKNLFDVMDAHIRCDQRELAASFIETRSSLMALPPSGAEKSYMSKYSTEMSNSEKIEDFKKRPVIQSASVSSRLEIPDKKEDQPKSFAIQKKADLVALDEADSIPELAQSVFDLYQELLLRPELKSRSTQDSRDLIDQFGRLNIWMEQTGATLRDAKSLVGLLQNDAPLRISVAGAFHQLKDLLTRAGSAMTITSSGSSGLTPETQDETDSLTSDSEYSGDDPGDQQHDASPRYPRISRFSLILSHISEQIRLLYHYSSVFRRPGFRDQSLHSDACSTPDAGALHETATVTSVEIRQNTGISEGLSQSTFLKTLLKTYTCGMCEKSVTLKDARFCSFCGPNWNADPGENDANEEDVRLICVTCEVPECTLNPCKVRGHETCWDLHLPSSSRLAKRHKMLIPAEKIIIAAVKSPNDVRGDGLLELDGNTQWFNIKQDPPTYSRYPSTSDGQNIPVLQVYDRFRQLCNKSQTASMGATNQYPSIVSFIGDTGTGKSSLVRAMMAMGSASEVGLICDGQVAEDADVGRLVPAMTRIAHGWPVVGTGTPMTAISPTTEGVHLYLDENPNLGLPEVDQYSILFADCEGFGDRGVFTNNEALPNDEGNSSKGKSPMRTQSLRRPRSRRMESTPEYEYRVTAGFYRGDKHSIDIFNKTFLYAVSDIIVFVARDDSRMRWHLMEVMEWAVAAFHQTINQPSRKTLIIVQHTFEQHVPAFYEEDFLSELWLEDDSNLWTVSQSLNDFVRKYNANQPDFRKRITTNRRLYDTLFRRIMCWYVPSWERVEPSAVVRQWAGLRQRIEIAVRDEQSLRSVANMKRNVIETSDILSKAFVHFATSDLPFDFYLAARKHDSNPFTMASHLANFLAHGYRHAETIPDIHAVDSMLIDAIVAALLTWMMRRFSQGMGQYSQASLLHNAFINCVFSGVNPCDGFDRELRQICVAAVEEYVESYETCTYQFPDGSCCVSRPKALHLEHMSGTGKSVSGAFRGRARWTHNSWSEWLSEIREKFSNEYLTILETNPELPRRWGLQRGESPARDQKRQLYLDHAVIWANIKSNKTCFLCLDGVPNHVLSCGHAYCSVCIQELGTPSIDSECSWLLSNCYLCGREEHLPHSIQLKPRCAGVRVLALDGGGIRGVVELELLRALTDEIGLGVPIWEYFDLMVGTGTGMSIQLL